MNNFTKLIKTLTQKNSFFVVFLVLLLNLFILSSVNAGDNEVVSSQTNQSGGSYQQEKVSTYPVSPSVETIYFGIVPRALSMRKPLELINPLAATKYGYGRDMVSWNTRAGKPKGFIIAGVRFW